MAAKGVMIMAGDGVEILPALPEDNVRRSATSTRTTKTSITSGSTAWSGARRTVRTVQPLAVLTRGRKLEVVDTCARVVGILRFYWLLLRAALPPTLLAQVLIIMVWNVIVVLIFQNVVENSADMLAEWGKFEAAAKYVLQACASLLGFLIVFSSTENYDRWWEARVSWGQLMKHAVELSDLASSCIHETALADRIVRHTIAYAYLSKQLLREEPLDFAEFDGLLTEGDFATIMGKPGWNPMYCLQVCRACVREACRAEPIPVAQDIQMERTISALNASLGVGLRLKYTKIPLGHVCYLVTMTWGYLLLLPFALVDEMGWWLLMVSGVLTWLMMGIENAGWSMLDPFGYEPDSLPLDSYCEKIKLQCSCVFLNAHQRAGTMARPEPETEKSVCNLLVSFPEQIRNRNTKFFRESDDDVADMRKTFRASCRVETPMRF